MKTADAGSRPGERALGGASSWGRWCRELGSRSSAPLQHQGNRRWLVGMFALILAAFPLSGWLTDRLWVVMTVLIPYGLGVVLLATATRRLLDCSPDHLDERQDLVRRTLFREPYATGATLGLAGGMVVVLALDASEPLMGGTLLAVVGLLYGFPSMRLAWTLPDEDDDEHDHDA